MSILVVTENPLTDTEKRYLKKVAKSVPLADEQLRFAAYNKDKQGLWYELQFEWPVVICCGMVVSQLLLKHKPDNIGPFAVDWIGSRFYAIPSVHTILMASKEKTEKLVLLLRKVKNELVKLV